MYPKNKTYYSW